MQYRIMQEPTIIIAESLLHHPKHPLRQLPNQTLYVFVWGNDLINSAVQANNCRYIQVLPE